ncbi:hypothetical protein [Mycobacterium sp. URHB0021]
MPDDVAVLWSSEETCPLGQPPCPGTWFGIHVPVPQTIVDVSLFVAVLSALYFTVSTSVDPLYRAVSLASATPTSNWRAAVALSAGRRGAR